MRDVGDNHAQLARIGRTNMLTLDQARAELLEICRTYPERTGTVSEDSASCVYYINREGKGIGIFDSSDPVHVVTAHGGDDLAKPCCLVGMLIERHRTEWLPYPGVYHGVVQNMRASEALSDAPITQEALDLLDEVQKEQDGGTQWGNLITFIQSYQPMETDGD